MGMRLIEGMAKGLSGTLKVEGDKRTCITVRFPFAKAEQPSPNGA
jgi:two-component sensor histidine kinase